MSLYKSTLFFVSICIKIFIVNWLIFSEIRLLAIFTEICFIILLFSLIELLSPKKSKTVIYFIVTLLISLLFFSVIIYHDFFETILTLSALQHAGQLGDIKESILSLIQPEYLIFFADLPIIFLLLCRNKEIYYEIKKRNIIIITGVSALLISVNMFSHSKIVNEKLKARNIGIINYQIYAFIEPLSRSFGKHGDISQSLINNIKDINPKQTGEHNGIAKDKNVIVIQLESVQNFLINKTIAGKEITPNLNQLVKNSVYFNNIYQQIGKGNTSDAEFIINTSVYPRGNVAMSEEYGHKDIPSLPKLLKKHGYTSLTFHTNDVTFWNRNELYQALGFDEVYDKKYFGDHDVISYGPSDEILYAKSLARLKQLHQKGEKFYANLISMSSHHPFKIPDTKRKLPLPKEYEDTNVGMYLQAVHYADYALGNFLQKLKENNLRDDTLLIIYGDHFGLQIKTDKDQQLANKIIGREYHEKIDKYNIPLIISLPGKLSGGELRKAGGQIDIMPTITALLGISLEENIHFGQDLFTHKQNLIGVGNRFYFPTGSFLNDDILFVPGESFEDGTAFSLKTHQPLDKFNKYKKDFNRILQLTELSDQYMEMLPERKE